MGFLLTLYDFSHRSLHKDTLGAAIQSLRRHSTRVRESAFHLCVPFSRNVAFAITSFPGISAAYSQSGTEQARSTHTCLDTLSIYSRQAEVSHATVLAYLKRYGIEIRERDLPNQRKGQIPFKWMFRDAGLVKNPIEQEIIRMMRQYISIGGSFCGIARELNRKLVPTINNGIWQANTVRRIFRRVNGERQRVSV